MHPVDGRDCLDVCSVRENRGQVASDGTPVQNGSRQPSTDEARPCQRITPRRQLLVAVDSYFVLLGTISLAYVRERFFIAVGLLVTVSPI